MQWGAACARLRDLRGRLSVIVSGKAIQRIQVAEREVTEIETDLLRAQIGLSARRREIAAVATDTQVHKRVFEASRRLMSRMDELQQSRNVVCRGYHARDERCRTLR